jgi:AraC-like DNA-binding protein
MEWIHGESIEMKCGDWLVISPGVSHSTINISKDALAYFSMHFDIEDVEIRNELKNMNFVHLRGPFSKLQNLFTDLQREIGEGSTENGDLNTNQKLLVQSIILRLFQEVLQLIDLPSERIVLHNKMLNIGEIELATTIERMLNAHMDSTITIHGIAEQLYISRSHCNEVFKKVYGIAPRAYLSMLKVKKAEALLLHSGLSIEAIGEKLGFSCIGSFSRQFRRWTDLSPMQYRNSQRYLLPE